MKTEKIDLKEVEVFDLMDQPVLLPTLFIRDLGNGIYIKYRDIERQDLGRKIFMSDKMKEDLVMDTSELNIFIPLFEEMSLLNGLLHNSILKYLKEKLEKLNKAENGNDNK